MTQKLQGVLDGLMSRYKERVPDVAGVINAMIREGVINTADEIENDHIAFRTMGVEHLGIKSLEKVFLHLGYTKRDYYFFPEKKLNAYWYAPPSETFPRIFISELRVDDLSPAVQKTIRKYTDEVKSDPVDALDLNDVKIVDNFLHSSLWQTPLLEDYLALAKESEYAAWVIYNRYYLNHFTVSVHNLKPGYNTIEAFNAFLERNGFILNDAGGKFKKSPDGLLLQSSTVAQMIEAEFANGKKHMIAGSYAEFAERKVRPEFSHIPASEIKREHRREGFEAQNANKIFESTYQSQTSKHG
ncbi:DUF1338 domain-containing protein [Pseudochryseolinea flava]|uniref:2-oxoadipate dioxygenase/decarboxylase n=1 Tax=Pseudochryseolinea flava TaxID=2059302 RepID=A0A364Y2S5_9BACT|nr:DUF1338 domain-containing protein [Pseudochryseolinea flava]RAW00982.1 DUF1338 domain-containing protein [Pseudochryseolinea flava]